MDLFLLPYFDHLGVNYFICSWNFLVPIRHLLTPEMEGSYCPSWTTTAISMMILLRHWWINLDNYFVNFVYLLSVGLFTRAISGSLAQALAYLVREYCFSKYYHSALVIKLINDLPNYYVVYFLNAITDNAMTSL